MDSCNSGGSFQSSSDGEEEYDSRADAADESVSAFISGGPISNPPPPFFHPLSNYLELQQNPDPSSLLDTNPAWRRVASLRSDPNSVTRDVVGTNVNMLSSSSNFMPSFQPADRGDTSVPTTAPPTQLQNHTAARNLKKRARASRRAPTTVLTTDTTNFRAMVQEFTGIPAPPFDSSYFPRTRLDLFGSRSSTTSYDAQLPPYLRSPFAQKVQPPLPFLAFTSSPSAIGASSSSTTTNNNNIITASSSNPAINYQIPVTQTSSNHFQNPFLNSLLQTNPKFPFSESMASKPHQSPFHIPSNDHSHTQFGLSGHGNSLIPSDQQISQRNDPINNTDKDENDGNGDYNFSSSTENSKMNDNLNLSHHGRGRRSENNITGEGLVESWICSSE
ncbi:hypothetical protein OROGR_019060 [Orobanche gracilis]